MNAQIKSKNVYEIFDKISETLYNDLFSSKENLGLRKVIYYYCRKFPYVESENEFLRREFWRGFKQDAEAWFTNKYVAMLGKYFEINVFNNTYSFVVSDLEFSQFTNLPHAEFALNFSVRPVKYTFPECDTLWPYPTIFYFNSKILETYNIPKTYKEYLNFIRLLQI